mgnify:CR=1 FL=1
MKNDWNEYRTKEDGFSQEIQIHREDVEDIIGDEISDKEWYVIHETLFDKLNDMIINHDYEEMNS